MGIDVDLCQGDVVLANLPDSGAVALFARVMHGRASRLVARIDEYEVAKFDRSELPQLVAELGQAVAELALEDLDRAIQRWAQFLAEAEGAWDHAITAEMGRDFENRPPADVHLEQIRAHLTEVMALLTTALADSRVSHVRFVGD